jgi:hypothetical protein
MSNSTSNVFKEYFDRSLSFKLILISFSLTNRTPPAPRPARYNQRKWARWNIHTHTHTHTLTHTHTHTHTHTRTEQKKRDRKQLKVIQQRLLHWMNTLWAWTAFCWIFVLLQIDSTRAQKFRCFSFYGMNICAVGHTAEIAQIFQVLCQYLPCTICLICLSQGFSNFWYSHTPKSNFFSLCIPQIDFFPSHTPRSKILPKKLLLKLFFKFCVPLVSFSRTPGWELRV